MNRKLIAIAIVIVVIVASIAGYFAYQALQTSNTQTTELRVFIASSLVHVVDNMTAQFEKRQ
jgi:hypothetical protein